MLEKKVNWLITLNCNKNCTYCFRPGAVEEYSDRILFAKKLAEAKLRKVTISGGEPTIVENLPEILNILHDSGAYVSLHTNGSLLTPELVRKFRDFTDDVAIPLDSIYQETQSSLRPQSSLKTFDRAHDLLLSSGVNVGIHTVVTPLNLNRLYSLYSHVNQKDFKYWKFYQEKNTSSEEDDFHCGVNSFLADFVLTQSNMQRRLRDSRIEFVSSHSRMPYVFLKPDGKIGYGTWFEREWKHFGNLVRSDLIEVYQSIEDYIGSQDDANSFFEGRWNLPLWIRLSGIENDPDFSKMQLGELTHSERRRFWRLARTYNQIEE